MEIESTVYIERNDEEIELQVTAEYSPGWDGFYSGCPEYCYPAEGDLIEDLKVFHHGKPFLLTDAEESRVYKELEEKFSKVRY